MSYNLTDAKSKLALDVALTCKIEVYGMLYDVDWWEMFNRQMIINALDIDDTYTSSGENLVVSSDFSRWIGGNPLGWTVTESPPNSEITEVGSDEGYGGIGTGSCNIYSTSGSCYMKRDILTLGNLYIIKFDVTKVVTGELYIRMGSTGNIITGINEEKTYYFIKICNEATWFLPSKDELAAMYTNLHAEGVGDFANQDYWTSSETGASSAYWQSFVDGTQEGADGKNTVLYVRACRSFTAEAGVYALKDTGPAGGLIFYIDGGTTYYEAAPSDQSVSQAWSNVINVEIGAGAQGTAIGTGQGNTAAIIAQAGHTDSAAKLCDDLIVIVSTDDFIIGANALPTDITIDNLYVYDYPHPFPFLSTSEREKLEDRLTVLSNK